MKLRDYQIRAINQLRQKFKEGKKRVVLQLPTGGGKTELAIAIAQGALSRNNRMMFICERISLVEQAAIRFAQAGMHVGVLQGDHPGFDDTAPIQCASIQTLARRQWPSVDILVYDEVHVLHKTHKKIIETWPSIHILGLSATPWSKGLGRYFEDIVAPITTRELIDLGYLVEPIVYGPTKPDMSKVKTVRGDFDEKGSEIAAMPIIGDVVDHWLRLGENRPTAMFCVNIAHSKALVEQFRQVGVKAEHVDAYTDTDDRKATFKRFDSGETTIISSVDVIGRGWDQPKVSCILACRPTKSLIYHVQTLGRGLRPAMGKENCLILDFAGNHERLGFVTDPLPVYLDMGEKADKKSATPKEKLPEPCPKCSFMRPAGIYICPQCGFKPERQNHVEHAEGELGLISKRNRETPWEEKIAFMGQCKRYCTQYKKNPNKAIHLYREFYGVWPNDNRVRSAPEIPISDKVMQYIRSRNIRYAKRRNQEQANSVRS